ncbi:hypothetical protein HNQ80_001535 [Anaerosolibacter carboniphilus]|uniref:Uncharacterized protein n=1 Tax=Anaerosolibacter carboniphilus TaxID=1417629 RepID=A0A841KPQ2_9FIRM|nr:hypothetical protein [Anaerosolibacter carboniphilus]
MDRRSDFKGKRREMRRHLSYTSKLIESLTI